MEHETSWQHGYYLKLFNNSVPVLDGNKEATVDSILQRRSVQYDLAAFWFVGAHYGEPHLDPSVRARLDSAYVLVDEKEFYDAWAQFFVRRGEASRQ